MWTGEVAICPFRNATSPLLRMMSLFLGHKFLSLMRCAELIIEQLCTEMFLINVAVCGSCSGVNIDVAA
jgi:hypothetical protein